MSDSTAAPTDLPPITNTGSMPWQLLLVSILLGIEGIGDLLSVFQTPMAGIWLLAKVFFVVGFVKRWKAAYIAFLIVGSLHVLTFGLAGHLGIAGINLVLILLVFSQNALFINRSAFARILVRPGRMAGVGARHE